MVTAAAVPADSRHDRCPLCDGSERDSYVAFRELEFVRCRGCSVIYKAWETADLRPADLYEDAYYSPKKRSRRDKRFEHRVHKAQKQIAAALEVAPGSSPREQPQGAARGSSPRTSSTSDARRAS